MKVLYIAEIVGKAGVYALKMALEGLKKQKPADFVIAGADGVTGGNGLGRNHAAYLHKLGVNVLTTGECCFYKKDLVENLGKIPYVLRPENLNPQAPGIGARVYTCPGKFAANGSPAKIAVAVLLGQSGFTRLHGDNPFSRIPVLLERLRRETPYVIVDFHAEATAEKRTLFALADGACSAVIGSHNRIQTADETVLPGGTAVITDAGRTGSRNSVGGVDKDERIQEYLTGIPDWTRESWEQPEIQGVYLDIDSRGRSLSIERIQWPAPEPPLKETSAAEEELHD